MHELGIVRHVVNQVEKAAEDNNVGRVIKLTLEVGEVSSVVPDYFRDCFEWYKKKTKYMRDTQLELIILEGISYCTQCRKTYKTVEYGRNCPYCGSGETYLVTGNQMTIKDMLVE